MELTCPVCLNIYFKPINLPCGHTLCQQCLEKSMDMATLGCPICRYRLSTWKRKFKDISACIDKERDEKIAHLFPQYYSQKKMGLEASLCDSELDIFRNFTGLSFILKSECLDVDSPQLPIRLATPGTIKSEFDEAISRVTGIKNTEKSIHEEANLALSRQILLESETIDLVSVDENSGKSIASSFFCYLGPLESTRTQDATQVPQSSNRQHSSASHGRVPLSTQAKFKVMKKRGISAAFKSVSKQVCLYSSANNVSILRRSRGTKECLESWPKTAFCQKNPDLGGITPYPVFKIFEVAPCNKVVFDRHHFLAFLHNSEKVLSFLIILSISAIF